MWTELEDGVYYDIIDINVLEGKSLYKSLSFDIKWTKEEVIRMGKIFYEKNPTYIACEDCPQVYEGAMYDLHRYVECVYDKEKRAEFEDEDCSYTDEDIDKFERQRDFEISEIEDNCKLIWPIDIKDFCVDEYLLVREQHCYPLTYDNGYRLLWQLANSCAGLQGNRWLGFRLAGLKMPNGNYVSKISENYGALHRIDFAYLIDQTLVYCFVIDDCGKFYLRILFIKGAPGLDNCVLQIIEGYKRRGLLVEEKFVNKMYTVDISIPDKLATKYNMGLIIDLLDAPNMKHLAIAPPFKELQCFF